MANTLYIGKSTNKTVIDSYVFEHYDENHTQTLVFVNTETGDRWFHLDNKRIELPFVPEILYQEFKYPDTHYTRTRRGYRWWRSYLKLKD